MEGLATQILATGQVNHGSLEFVRIATLFRSVITAISETTFRGVRTSVGAVLIFN